MSGGSSANNSWTILTSEETAAETLRPLAEGTEHHDGSHTSAAEAAVSAEGLPAEDHLVSEDKTPEPSGHGDDGHAPADAVADLPTPTATHVPESGSQSEDLPEATAQSHTDPDSFSDSYTHISPSPAESPASPLSADTLGRLESIQEEERLTQDAAQHPAGGAELQQEGEESELSHLTTDGGKQADSPVASDVGEERLETKGEEEEPEERRRRSLLATLGRIGRTEEEEEADEDFQVPQREEDTGLTLNKCILGAVILLGLGTIFFSENDYSTRELKDSEAPGKQEWLNPDVPPPAADADSIEFLNKMAKGNEHMAVLRAELQAQKEELKVAVGQAAEGEKERLRREEVEKENSRLKKVMASLAVLQKENEKMKRELESVSALQKELERLRSTVTELKLSSAAEAPIKTATSPSSGHTEEGRQSTDEPIERQTGKPRDEQKAGKKTDRKKDKYDTGETKEWKDGDKSDGRLEKSARKDGGKAGGKEKEWKKGKPEQGKFGKEKDEEGKHKRHGEEAKRWKEKERQKEKAGRGDEGRPWKDREGKNERMEKSEKKSKYDKLNESKQWKGKDEKKEWKAGKEHGEKPKSKEDWKGEKEWKRLKDGKEKYERRDQKEKGEKKEWKKDGDWKSRNKEWKESERKHEGNHHDGERKEKDERRRGIKNEKEWKKKDERRQRGNEEQYGEEEWEEDGQKEKRHRAETKKGKASVQKHNSDPEHHHHNEEHVWGERKTPHTHREPSPDQPEYWVHQRARLQHSSRPPQQCDSAEACAHADGLRPVRFVEFQTTLQTYLTKAEDVGVAASITGQVRKLAAEYFKDGVFVHDQMSFRDYVEDLGDILEDLVEGSESDDEEDSLIEDEMEGFEREAMLTFSVPAAGGQEGRKESGRGRG